jgi:hypothetical protein
VGDTKGDADDESVGSNEEIRVQKPFACQAENCDFSHRPVWGIKKHYMVSRPSLFVFPKSPLSPSLEYFKTFCDPQFGNCSSTAKQTSAHFIVPISLVQWEKYSLQPCFIFSPIAGEMTVRSWTFTSILDDSLWDDKYFNVRIQQEHSRN